jgi:hypothetical protein
MMNDHQRFSSQPLRVFLKLKRRMKLMLNTHTPFRRRKSFSALVSIGILCMSALFSCSNACADVYKDQWRWYSKNEKIEYVRGLYDATMFTLRSVYVFDYEKKNAQYAQRIPAITDLRDVVEKIDDFYKTEDTDQISVAWVLYIIAQEQCRLPPERLLELKKTAISDYSHS